MLRSDVITQGRVSYSDQRFVLLIGHVPDPVKAVFYFTVAADPGGQGAGPASRSLMIRYTTSTVFLPFRVTVRRSCVTWAAPSNSIQAGASATLIVRRAPATPPAQQSPPDPGMIPLRSRR
jgi:hypothetical protein